MFNLFKRLTPEPTPEPTTATCHKCGHVFEKSTGKFIEYNHLWFCAEHAPNWDRVEMACKKWDNTSFWYAHCLVYEPPKYYRTIPEHEEEVKKPSVTL